jgi:hypothetical protein
MTKIRKRPSATSAFFRFLVSLCTGASEPVVSATACLAPQNNPTGGTAKKPGVTHGDEVRVADEAKGGGTDAGVLLGALQTVLLHPYCTPPHHTSDPKKRTCKLLRTVH